MKLLLAHKRAIQMTFWGVVSLGVLCACSGSGKKFEGYDSDQSAARNWNEALLVGIRNDTSRPTVHARNLFHASAMMYDLWAVYDDTADTYFLGQTVDGYLCPLSSEQRQLLGQQAEDKESSRSRAISYAMYTLLNHRFANAPGADTALPWFENLMEAQGLDPDYTSREFSNGEPQALGLYLADCVIEFGLQDGSNEENGYANRYYQPVNGPLDLEEPGTSGVVDPNRWQPLKYTTYFVGQGGFRTETKQPPFISPEWGEVAAFALPPEEFTSFERDSYNYLICHDPGPPALLTGDGAKPEEYKWAHSMVALWSSHLDPTDGVMWDISPASIGNTDALPDTIEGMRDFYDALNGGALDQGRLINPYAGEPYEPQLVPRGDYTRVLVEFWSDGPSSETPPGHWFVIANEAISDHPAFKKRYKGDGEELDALEWDVKLYFALGSAMHDAAVTAWGIKGRYDYVRPISAIRYMASLGQSSDSMLPSYHEHGIPLVNGQIALVEAGDELAGASDENIGKIKLRTWRGPDHVDDTANGIAGVGWILAENWYPFFPANFVTPPFAGYISGHSTFSRAAAEVLTAFTGDEYFPGGIGEFFAPKDIFLDLEKGPSVDVTLQWATYRDASDQTSLSRIWGGIHPPADDIPGRKLGIRIASDVMALADRYFLGTVN